MPRRHRSSKPPTASLTGLPVFSSEVQLQQAIASLFSKIPRISGVRVLQGAQEHGKDIVFVYQGALGEPIPHACIVKNSKLTGKTSVTSGVRTVFQQVQQALDTPYVDTTGQEVPIHKAYVMTPYELSAEAMNAIRGALREARGSVEFVGGRELFRLFKKFWPDFFYDECTSVERYLSSAARELMSGESIAAVASLYDLGSITDQEARIYVRPTISRVFYQLRVNACDEFLPPTKVQWSYSLFQNAQDGLDVLCRVVDFLSANGYWDPGREQSATYASEFVRRARDSIVQAWTNSVKRRAGRGSAASMPRIKKGVEVPLGESGAKAVQEIRNEIDAGLLKLRALVTKTNNVCSSDERTFWTGIHKDEFLRLLAFHDCARYSPGGVVQVIGERQLNLGKDVFAKANGKSIVIVGPAGSGKTTYCRWNALNDAERYMTGDATIVPVYVVAHRLGREGAKEFEGRFLSRLGESALIAGEVRREWEAGRVSLRIYLDGLDEIPEVVKRREIIESLRVGVEHNPRIQAVVTARDYIYGPWLSWLPRLTLSGLGDEEVHSLVRQWLGDDARSRNFLDQLKGVPTLSPLMRTPLLATLMLLVFRKTQRLPESKTALYRMVIDLLCGGWDFAKGVLRSGRFGRDAKVLVLIQLALENHRRERKEFGRSELRAAIAKIFGSLEEADLVALGAELFEDGVITASGSVFQFAHLSFQEYLTARGLIGGPGVSLILVDDLEKALGSVIAGDDWWHDVVGFYMGLLGNPVSLCTWLEKSLKGGAVERRGCDVIVRMIQETYPGFVASGLNEDRRGLSVPMEYEAK